MVNESGYLSLGNDQLHYLKTGTGKRVLLAFHGYGNDASIFKPIEEYLVHQFIILSFDLPYHGKSVWSDAPLTQKDLLQMVDIVKKQYDVEKVSLLGYSLGGRVCLNAIEIAPESIDKVTLLATDGLVQNHYYSFFTNNYFGKKMFRNMLEKPARYFKVMDWFKKLHLVHPSRHKFAMHSLSTPEARNLLLKVWPAMSKLIPSPSRLRNVIAKNRIPVVLFMGVNDKIMPPRLGAQFKAGLDTVQLHILNRGHIIFDHENAEQIAKSLL
jgi:pimeloyl-ACP methyl ester carboxylesterase